MAKKPKRRRSKIIPGKRKAVKKRKAVRKYNRKRSNSYRQKPKRSVLSTKDWVLSNHAGPTLDAGNFREYYPDELVTYSEAKGLDDAAHKWFETRSVMSRPAFAVVLKKGRVWGRNGAVLTSDRRLLADVSWEFSSKFILFKKHSVFRKWKPYPVKDISGTVGLLTHPSSGNYFHWLFDVLPRIHLLRRNGRTIDKYLFHAESIQNFHDETLNMMGIPAAQRIFTNPQFHLKARRLVVPSLMSDYTWSQGHYPLPITYSRWACHFVRNELMTDHEPISGEGERLYISRAKADKRRLLNEEEIMTKLESLGFTAITPDSMTVRDQIARFASAAVVVAPHGAGLANLAFCSPGAKVIELFSPAYVPTYYWILSNHFGLDYYYLIGDRSVWHKHTWAGATDFYVNPERFSRLLIRAGIE